MESILGVWHRPDGSLDVLILAHIAARSIGPTGLPLPIYSPSDHLAGPTRHHGIGKFFVDVAAITKGKRRESLAALLTLIIVGIALTFTLVQNARVSAENRALTD
ncbi:MAG: hypothetical protein LC775_14195, partial [Acidobacteria bacterium]|nr:hypothetical protein [Acidobacteriota bacterium]